MLLIVLYLLWKEMEQASYCYKYYHVGPLEKKANRDNYSMGQRPTTLLQKFFSEPKIQQGLLVVLVNTAIWHQGYQEAWYGSTELERGNTSTRFHYPYTELPNPALYSLSSSTPSFKNVWNKYIPFTHPCV